LPNIIFGLGGILESFQTVVSSLAVLRLDPPPGWSYSLTETLGSPEFASMVLPLQDNIAAWELTYFTDTGGSGTEISNTGTFDFGPGVDRLDFFALDDQNSQIAVVTPFVFGLTFDSLGTFDGTLIVTDAPNSAPEPASATIIGIGLAGLMIARSRKRPRQP
jgi:hypothetical protein